MNKGKILKITENTVYIGYEDGSLKEISIESCDFEPAIGDYVEVYGDIAIKVEGSNESTPVKKSEAKEISLVSKINLILFVVLAMIILSAAFYMGESMLKATAILFFVVSVLMIVLNLIFIIISSIKKSEVNKESSIKYFIVGILTVILSIAFAQYVNNTPSNSKKTTSQSTSKSSTSSSKNSSSSSSSSKASSSTTPSSSKESSPSSSSSVPSKPKITVDNDKANYGEVDYNSWNHDEVAVNTKVRVYGKVLQAMEDRKAYTLRVAINDDYDKIILVSIPSEYNNRVIAEDDHITLYGLAQGRQSYETVFKATKTLPYMVAYMYDN
ncbi:hypothetical protein ACORHU_09785 [Streptococcus sp. KHUD_015]|uniref:hypothetical protein n=1 Tax=Streptococcus sp. KHUD_015 TaxID=3434352 RepID=UPI003DA47DFC